jgi:hypothetical protein
LRDIYHLICVYEESLIVETVEFRSLRRGGKGMDRVYIGILAGVYIGIRVGGV